MGGIEPPSAKLATSLLHACSVLILVRPSPERGRSEEQLGSSTISLYLVIRYCESSRGDQPGNDESEPLLGASGGFVKCPFRQRYEREARSHLQSRWCSRLRSWWASGRQDPLHATSSRTVPRRNQSTHRFVTRHSSSISSNSASITTSSRMVVRFDLERSDIGSVGAATTLLTSSSPG